MPIEQHPRIPAIIIILCSYAFCAVLSLIFVDDAQQHVDFDELEKTVNKTNDSKVWMQYAQILNAQGRQQHAVQAYQEILKREPYNNHVRYQCALVLAQGDDEEAYFQYMQELVLSYPKMATELFTLPECQRFLTQNRFRILAHEARVQAVD